MATTTWIIKENFTTPAGDKKYYIRHILTTPTESSIYGTLSNPRRYFCIGYSTSTTDLKPQLNSLVSCLNTSTNLTNRQDVPVSAGWKVTFIDDVYNNSELSSWLESNAVLVEPIKVEGSIDYDEDWNQEDCHWALDRIFTVTYKIYYGDLTSQSGIVLPGETYSDEELYYNIGLDATPIYLSSEEINQSIKSYETVRYKSNYTRRLKIIKYSVKVSDFLDKSNNSSLKTLINDNGELRVLFTLSYKNNFNLSTSCQVSKTFILDYPPNEIDKSNFTQSKVTGANNSDKILYYWDIPEDNSNEVSLAGYCVEVERKVGENNWEKIRGLTFDATSRNINAIDGTTGITSYELLLDPDYKNPFEEATPAGVEMTFVSSSRNPGKDCEAYLVNYNTGKHHSFFFTPKGIGLNRGEEFSITIYPYVVHSQYYEDGNVVPQPSAFLTNSGTTLGEGKVSKGTVRVYYNNEWKEGQVWVYTGSGWKQAEAVYAYNDGAWKESQ
jgi:hypothetical protein